MAVTASSSPSRCCSATASRARIDAWSLFAARSQPTILTQEPGVALPSNRVCPSTNSSQRTAANLEWDGEPDRPAGTVRRVDCLRLDVFRIRLRRDAAIVRPEWADRLGRSFQRDSHAQQHHDGYCQQLEVDLCILTCACIYWSLNPVKLGRCAG